MIRALFLLLVLTTSALAAPKLPREIPSSASGEYMTPAGLCQVIFSRFGADHINVDIACPGVLGVEDGRVLCAGLCSHSTVFAFGGACIGSPGVANAFPVQGSNPESQWLYFGAMDGVNLVVRRGASAAELYNGGGVPEYWTRLASISSPAPYSCASVAPTRSWLCGITQNCGR